MNLLPKMTGYSHKAFNFIWRRFIHQNPRDKDPVRMSCFSLAEQAYMPVDKLIRHRSVETSQIEKIEAFDKPGAIKINNARMDHLASLQLPFDGQKVIDVGCGVGHLAQFFVNRKCDVFCIDAREALISELRKRYPDLRSAVFDVQTGPILNHGRFDIVFCYGLLYHLTEPFQALRNMAEACSELLLLETCITDHSRPLVNFVEETATYSQSLCGVGCRPTPSFVIMALLHAGFEFVYIPTALPSHPDFQYAWREDLTHVRDGRNLRQVFVASRSRLQNKRLIEVGQCR